MKYKHFFEQCITRYNGQWHCYLCKIMLPNLRNVKRHLEDAHSPVNIPISDFLNKAKMSKKKYKMLVRHGIVIRKIQHDYFCVNCLHVISSLHGCFQHLKENHHKCTNSLLNEQEQSSNNNTNNEQSNTSVNEDNPTEHTNKSNLLVKMQSVSENKLMKDTPNNSTQKANETIASVPYALLQEPKTYKHFLMQHTVHYGQWYCHLCKSSLQSLSDVTRHLQEIHPDNSTQIPNFLDEPIELSDVNCTESSNHKITMQDIPQDSFCKLCQCSLSSSYHFYEHSIGKRHKLMTQRNEKCINANVVLKDPADKQQNLNNDAIDNQNVSIDVLDENDLIRNLPSNFKEESTVSSESCHENGISDSLQTERYINMIFCCLCDTFVHNTAIKNHMESSLHKSAASMLGISKRRDQQMCIMKLEKEKGTLKALRLNSKRFDGTTWLEYTEITAKYTCDQCNKMVEEDDIINHEITVHKSGMMFSMKFMYDWSPTRKDLNVAIYYPLFKCSFCNEIIHGIWSLQDHFLKTEHEENIKSLIHIKRREYDSCKNMQIYLEPLEFLSLISFENNNGSIQIQEQSVIYIKNHCTSFSCYKNTIKMQKKFTYVCFDCQLTFFKIHDIIEHLCKVLRHLEHFKNIFLTYKYIHNVSTSRELILDETEHQVKSPVSKEDDNELMIPIDNESLKEYNIDKIQVNTEQYFDRNLIVEVNTSDKNNRLCQNEENNSGLFISLDIFTEINKLIQPRILNKNVKSNPNKNSLSNKIYEKEFLDFEEIMFACNERKLKEIKSNLRFFLPRFDKVYCLVCNNLQLCHKDIQSIYEHISSENHIHLMNLYKNKEHLKLLEELVKIQSTSARCFACNETVNGTLNKNTSSRDYKYHIYFPSHKNNRRQLLDQLENLLENFQNLWYNIQYFACADCNVRYKIKIKFMEHLIAKHTTVLINKDNSMFDFCLTCASLWYKNESCGEAIRTNYQLHCQQQTHQYLKKSNDFAVTSLPQSLEELLRNVDKIAANLFKLSNDTLKDPKMIQLTNALKHVFKTCKLPVEVCMFGSRVTGLALTNSDIDIYLNFGDECAKPESIKRRSKQIQDCLHTDHENWDIELTLNTSRTPIVRVRHRSTGLQCDLSFMNGLSVENSKLIRSFNIAYPPCQKLTLFLKKWLSLGGLTGPQGITNYALVWLVIFYLQIRFKIPSIADLIRSHNQSKIVSGWETGVSDTILINVQQLPVHELLLGFFEYYRNFNYWHLVICPLLGETCNKKAFAEVSTLPNSMILYTAQLQKENSEYFRIDSCMCVQDPFDLSHNLTKAVSILTLKRFKHYCKESLSVLRRVIASSRKEKKLSHYMK